MHSKIIIRYYNENDEKNIQEEGVWATKLNNGLYQIDNIPFFARSLSLSDIVSIEKINSQLYVLKLIESSGNSTVRIVFENKNIINKVIEELKLKGCVIEYNNLHQMLSVNIPSQVDYYRAIKPYLEIELNSGVLDYEESCLVHNNM